jgi:hypothetical protein
MKPRKDKTLWIIGLITALLICIAFALNNSNNEGTELPRAQFNDANPTGAKGLQLLLQRQGYTVKPVYEPQRQVPSDAKVWLILDPQTSFSSKEANQLLAWVRSGGLLIYCSDAQSEALSAFSSSRVESSGKDLLRSSLGIESTHYGSALQPRPPIQPELGTLTLDKVSIYRTDVQKASGSSFELRSQKSQMLEIAGSPGGTIQRFEVGKGYIFALPDAWIFTNYGLAQDDNATLVNNLITVHQRGGAAYFDERNHDDSLAPPERDSVIARLKKPPYSTAIWQLLIGVLIFWAFVGRRLGSAISLPVSGPVTRASLFAQAMGGLFQKVGRPKAAGTVIGENFRRRLARRVGLSPLESDEVLARRTHELCGIPVETVDRLLLHGRAPSESEAAILRDAQEMERVLRILEGER